jgi:Xaa-Pro aminopeptidase
LEASCPEQIPSSRVQVRVILKLNAPRLNHGPQRDFKELLRVTTETLALPTPTAPGPDAASATDRRADVESKMARVAALLQEAGCEGLLILEPENIAWLTSGATARHALDPGEAPGLYCNGESRWVLAGNADSQRIFDEEVDGLGFQLKEWPWHWGREQLLHDLCLNRRVACDRPHRDLKPVGDALRRLRRLTTPYEQACFRALGQLLAHALEATCRGLEQGQTEREAAGHLSHRLIHRGAQVVHLGVADDDRSRLYRHYSFTSTPIRRYAVLTATARKYGLTAAATRAVCFGELPPSFRNDHNAVCRVAASYLASTWPDAVPREILLAGRRIYLISGYEHEWLHCPQGHLTGRAAVELHLTPKTEELFQPGMAVTWHASAGAATSCDTFLITEKGPETLTQAEQWPFKRIRIQGAEFVLPDVLQR